MEKLGTMLIVCFWTEQLARSATPPGLTTPTSAWRQKSPAAGTQDSRFAKGGGPDSRSHSPTHRPAAGLRHKRNQRPLAYGFRWLGFGATWQTYSPVLRVCSNPVRFRPPNSRALAEKNAKQKLAICRPVGCFFLPFLVHRWHMDNIALHISCISATGVPAVRWAYCPHSYGTTDGRDFRGPRPIGPSGGEIPHSPSQSRLHMMAMAIDQCHLTDTSRDACMPGGCVGETN
jgi:hypothetical protein